MVCFLTLGVAVSKSARKQGYKNSIPTSENDKNLAEYQNGEFTQYEISSFIDQLKGRFYCNIM